jgi:predicted O-methyltransferase YrrM
LLLRHVPVLKQWIAHRERQTFRFPPGHFYSPIPDVDQVLAQGERIFAPASPTVPGVDLNVNEQLRLLDQLATYMPDQPFADGPSPGLRYYFENPYYRYADGLFLHAIMRHFRPKRIIEVGSGFSSAVMLDTDERFLDRSTEFTFVEPHAQRLRQLLRPGDSGYARIIEREVQQIPLELFASLTAGDILFIDSSHVAKVGSDVNHLVFSVLPELADGVIVHFHDVFYPFEYPKDWIVGGMAWNEAYVLRAFLQFNQAFGILLFNDYLGQLHRQALQQRAPLAIRDTGGSLWLRKRDRKR